MIVAIEAVLFGCVPFAHDEQSLWSAIVMVQLVCGALGIIYCVIAMRERLAPLPSEFGSMDVEVVDAAALDYFVDGTGMRALDYPQMLAFVNAILVPRGVFRRISETVEQYHRSIAARSTFMIVLEDGFSVDDETDGPHLERMSTSTDSADFVIPLLLPEKGELIDGIRAFDGSGSRVSTLDSQRTVAYSLAVLRGMVWLSSIPALAVYVAELEPLVQEELRGATPASPATIDDLSAALGSLDCDPDGATVREITVSLLRALLTVHPICVTIPAREQLEQGWAGGFRFTIERRFVPPINGTAETVRPTVYAAVLDSVGLALGVRPRSSYVQLANAGRTASYHLEVVGRPGTYVAAQEVIGTDVSQLRARIQPMRGQRRAHLHIRAIAAGEQAFFATRFFERAPGSFFVASVSSLSAAIIITVLAVREAADVGVGTTNLSLLSALLAVPIGVTALSGVETVRGTAHPSVLSRLVGLATVGLCLLSLLLTAIPVVSQSDLGRSWLLVDLVAWVVAVVSVTSWITRLIAESRRRMSRVSDT